MYLRIPAFGRVSFYASFRRFIGFEWTLAGAAYLGFEGLLTKTICSLSPSFDSIDRLPALFLIFASLHVTMKKTLHTMALCFLAASSWVACKKGSEDPWFSFRSREGRVTGTWNVVSADGEIARTIFYTSGAPFSFTKKISEGNNAITNTYTYGSTTITETGNSSLNSYVFVDDGTYSRTWNYTISRDSSITVAGGNGTITITTQQTYLEKGTWDFNGGVGAGQSMEYLLLTMSSRKLTLQVDRKTATLVNGQGTTTNETILTTDEKQYGPGDLSTYRAQLIKLSNSDIKMELDYNNYVSTGVSVTNTGGTSSTSSPINKAEGTITLQLKQ